MSWRMCTTGRRVEVGGQCSGDGAGGGGMEEMERRLDWEGCMVLGLKMACIGVLADRGENAGGGLKCTGDYGGKRQRHKGAKATGRKRFRTKQG